MGSSKLLSTLQQATGRFRLSTRTEAYPESSQPYLTGLRGVLAIESLLWAFLTTFVPATVSQTPGSTWQHVLRDVFSVLFWNKSLIYAFFIILSARTVCVPFLKDPCAATLAGSLVKRPLRIGISLSIASAISIAVFSTIESGYFGQFTSVLPNATAQAPDTPATPLAGFLSIYNILWLVRDWHEQAANLFWPTATLWVPSLIYYQSYTVYILMVLLPFTRPEWHFQGLVLFGLGSFWLVGWGWYSATGLLIADLAINPTLQRYLKNGFKVTGNFALPIWAPAIVSILSGLAMKYLWTAALPQDIDNELTIRPELHTADSLTTSVVANSGQPYARVDDWLVIVGCMVLVEALAPVQRIFSSQVLTFLGSRSFSIWIAQSLLFYTAGIKIFNGLSLSHGLTAEAASAVVLVSCVPLVILGAEIFHRLVDRPAVWFAAKAFTWIRE